MRAFAERKTTFIPLQRLIVCRVSCITRAKEKLRETFGPILSKWRRFGMKDLQSGIVDRQFPGARVWQIALLEPKRLWHDAIRFEESVSEVHGCVYDMEFRVLVPLFSRQ